ncbi:MAG: methylmalonyl Co-A mutase-associated GTPase MeaB [Candidatus Aminicenantes bacterium]
MLELAQQVLKGNLRAVAKAISSVENDGPEARRLMKEIFPHSGQSVVVGITGAPGSGKSTLVDQMIPQLKKKDKKIGIVAVDPSSPFSGGAILGDRIRMMRHSSDPDVFIRSMATRGHLGGLAKATGEAITVLEAGGKNLVMVETVGVGQDEVEVVKLADIIIVVLFPGSGDDVQIFKAGIMEIADVFVLNKADSPDTEKVERQLRAMLEMGLKSEEALPLIKTIATEGTGIKKLISTISRLVLDKNRGERVSRKKRLISWMLKDIITERIYRGVTRDVLPSDWEEWVDKIYKRETDPYTVADEIVRKIKGGGGET